MLNVQIDMVIKILILKNKYVARKKYVHVRARLRTINHFGLINVNGSINLFSKQSDQRLPQRLHLILIQLVTLIFLRKKLSQILMGIKHELNGTGVVGGKNRNRKWWLVEFKIMNSQKTNSFENDKFD